MVDPRFAWFAIGALSGAALFAWPWHSRFSRYSRRGSNPPPPGRKPAPLAGPPEQPLAAQLIRYWAWKDEQVRRAWLDLPAEEPHPEDRQPAPPAGAPIYGWGPRQLEPPPPAPGMHREYLWSPSLMAECNGPCWDTQDPRCCDCGALWRDVPNRMTEGRVQPFVTRDEQTRRAVSIATAMHEGRTQGGNCSGGPTTPKPPIKPQPSGGRLFINNKPTEDN